MPFLDPLSRPRLGCHKSPPDARTFRLASFFKEEVPEPPTSCRWSEVSGIKDWPEFANDKYGDCVPAGRAGQHMLRRALVGESDVPTDDSVIADYRAITKLQGDEFNPDTGENDTGCNMLTALKYFRKAGRIGAYVSFDTANLRHLRFVIWAFGGAYVACGLPNTIWKQKVWDVTDPKLQGDAAPGSAGGHCFLPIDYDSAAKTIWCKTWNVIQPYTEDWNYAYMNSNNGWAEGYAVLSNEMLDGKGDTPAGFRLDKLQRFIKAL